MSDFMLRDAQLNDWAAVELLLMESGLPVEGAREHLERFVVAVDAGLVVGVAGLEIHGTAGLLRSVAVHPRYRGQRLAERLVAQVLGSARGARLRSVFLLTTTAGDYFPRFGFRQVPRLGAPAELQASEEFKGACPASAALLALDLAAP